MYVYWEEINFVICGVFSFICFDGLQGISYFSKYFFRNFLIII